MRIFFNIDLRDDLSEAQLAEVRWHLGLGPQPAEVTIVTTTYIVPAEDGSWPEVLLPVLAGKGEAVYFRGGQVSAMARRSFERSGRGITARQELHVDGIEDLRTFVAWLVGHADCNRDEVIGYLRRFDHPVDSPSYITVKDDELDWPYYT
jgi:hypothetical protein